MSTDEYRKLYGDRIVLRYNTSKDLYCILEILGQPMIKLPKLGKYHLQIITESNKGIKSQPLFIGDYVLIQFTGTGSNTKAQVNIITPDEYAARLNKNV